MRYSKLILAGLAATFMMAVAVSSASANRLSISSSSYKSVYRSLEFREPEGSFGTVQCPVTLEGSFHSATIAKVLGALIGAVTKASVAGANCTGGSATVLTETLPWHVTYQGFSGRLPIITAVRLLLLGAAFRIHIHLLLEFFCLAKSEANHPLFGEQAVESGGTARALTPDSSVGIPTVGSGGSGCPATEGRFSAPTEDGQTTTGAGTALIIKLI